MSNNKLLYISLIIIISILILSIASFIIVKFVLPYNGEGKVEKEQTIDDILPLIVNVPKINTNLGDSAIIVLELTLQTDNEKAKEEAEKRVYQIQDVVNLYLKNLTVETFSSEEGINKFKSELKIRLNKLLQEGKIVNIDITQLFYQ